MIKKVTSIFIKIIAVVIISLILGSVGYKHYFNNMLFDAIKKEDIASVNYAIKKGANVNKFKYGKYSKFFKEIFWYNPTPLILACEKGNQEIISILIKNGADVNKKSFLTEETPLLAILSSDQLERFNIAKNLIENGADFMTVSDTITPLLCTIKKYDTDNINTQNESFMLFCFLIENGASVEVPSIYRETLLTYAVYYDNLAVVEYLIKNKYSDVNEKNVDGLTALMVAANRNSIASCKVLLDLGANKNIEDAEGRTAYDYARTNEYSEILEILIQD